MIHLPPPVVTRVRILKSEFDAWLADWRETHPYCWYNWGTDAADKDYLVIRYWEMTIGEVMDAYRERANA